MWADGGEMNKMIWLVIRVVAASIPFSPWFRRFQMASPRQENRGRQLCAGGKAAEVDSAASLGQLAA